MKPTYEELEAQVKHLAAELHAVEDIHNDAVFITDEDYEQCPKRVQDIIRNLAVMQIPAYDAFISRLRAEARAEVIPDGYVLVPQQMFLDSEDIESICSQCGNGAENEYGDYCDGLLWVGNIQDDAGNITHGLHISSADYPEDGGITLHAFPDQLREGKAGEVCNG